MTSETAAGVAKTYTYDNNGNLINAWNAGNPVGVYAYSLFGNQSSFTTSDHVHTYYTYRPDGLRHSIDDKVHIWDGANIVADVVGNDVVVYIRGINLIYADDGSRTYYHFNAHGDVVVLTNANGNKTKSYSYNAFGVEYNEATLDDNPFRYCGEYYDKETQTIYLRARYYNAEQGRFTQEDPIRDGYNWYAYCGNNPIMFVDPSGYAVRDCFSDETDMLDSPDMTSMGIGGGGKIISSYDSTAYNSYSIRSNTARYDASLGGYYSRGISSATANPNYYALYYEPTVGDDQVVDSDDLSPTQEKLSNKEKMQKVREKGEEGERIANVSGKKETIKSLTGTAKYRRPDGIDHKERIVHEVKNYKGKLYYTNQLKDYVLWAKENGYQVWIHTNATPSNVLQQLWDAGVIKMVPLS